MSRPDALSPAADALIDFWRFTREKAVLKGVLPLSSLPRLKDSFADDFEITASAALDFCLRGEIGGRGQPQLRIQVSGVLPLRCQRCLLPLEEPLAIDNLLELVAEEPVGHEPQIGEAKEDAPDFLCLPQGKLGMRSAEELVEDEILLALPDFPRHADCQAPTVKTDLGSHPFAALADWRRR